MVLPGFVDAHTHLVFAGNRLDDFEARARGETYEQIAKRGGGIQTTVQATRAASADELCALAKKRASWFLQNGTTTVEAKSGYGLTLEDELKILRVIRRVGKETPLETVATFLGAHAFPPEFREDRAGYISSIIDKMLPAIAREKLAEYCDIFCEQNYFNPEEARRILTAAQAARIEVANARRSTDQRRWRKVGGRTGSNYRRSSRTNGVLMASARWQKQTSSRCFCQDRFMRLVRKVS